MAAVAGQAKTRLMRAVVVAWTAACSFSTSGRVHTSFRARMILPEIYKQHRMWRNDFAIAFSSLLRRRREVLPLLDRDRQRHLEEMAGLAERYDSERTLGVYSFRGSFEAWGIPGKSRKIPPGDFQGFSGILRDFPAPWNSRKIPENPSW